VSFSQYAVISSAASPRSETKNELSPRFHGVRDGTS
jgi:hypothetical protein